MYVLPLWKVDITTDLDYIDKQKMQHHGKYQRYCVSHSS
ncbi:hypothetical protein AZE42_14187 [Rhizopogon vesiculosus]|uniref:Uncharacterized protein n=1 Tax=Rhizopogon vesiculosus TaxID=180088 RepID=A0A1J8QSG7_9AGAM|nr:hypothetical protein AZE42_14187 [Rhizopogon vesiculosus]